LHMANANWNTSLINENACTNCNFIVKISQKHLS
jgi:hypothetical protein